MKLRVLLCALLIAGSSCLFAQVNDKTEKHSTDYKNNPVWIEMMSDPQVNYYEALKAFDTYWEGKVEPEEEAELITEGKITLREADSLKAVRASWTQAQRNEYEVIKYQFKRFKDWKRTVFPFVQTDGRILSEQERLEIWQKQQQTENKH